MPREPNPSVVPSRETTRASGCSWKNHAGGEAVGVPRLIRIPAECSSSKRRSIQPKSYSPRRGSISAQEKIPMLTRFTPACRISSMSSAQVSSGHCSGL